MNTIKCDIKTFYSDIKEKNVICIGAGKEAENFFCEFKHILKNVIFFCDNDKKKHGTTKRIGEVNFKVCSLETALSNCTNCILLITTIHREQVLDQIKDIMGNNNICCYSSVEIRDITHAFFDSETIYQESSEAETFRMNICPVIPKIIHYCWFGGNKISDLMLKCIDSWRRFCPDYEIIKWDENNFDYKQLPYMKEAYHKKKWAFVSDVARLYIVYQYGGIYLDTDVELLKGLDTLLYNDGYIGFENNNIVNTGLGFGAKQGHNLIKEMLDDYKDKNFIKNDGTEDLKACPEIQTQILKRNGLIGNGEFQVIKKLAIYPPIYFNPKNPYTLLSQATKSTFSMHHYNASWLNKNEKEYWLKLRSDVCEARKKMERL